MRAGSIMESNPGHFDMSRMTVGSVSTHHGGSFSIKGLGAGLGFGRNESIIDQYEAGGGIQNDVSEVSDDMVFSGYEMEKNYKADEKDISKKMKRKHKKKTVSEPTQ